MSIEEAGSTVRTGERNKCMYVCSCMCIVYLFNGKILEFNHDSTRQFVDVCNSTAMRLEFDISRIEESCFT